MSVAIVGKVIGGLLLSVGGTALIVIKVLPSFNADVPLDKSTPSKNIDIYAISEAGTDMVSVEINTADDLKNYQCKFGSQNHECTIFKITDVDAAKKQTNIDDLKKDKTAQSITNTELKQADKIYKINIKSSVGDWSSNAKIEVISTDTGNDFGTKYASLKPLFALNSEYKPDSFTKTKYFVVKSTSTGTSNSTTTYKCLTDKEKIGSSTKPDKDCFIYDFSEDADVSKSWHEINFKKPITRTNSSITTNKYYLVALKEEVKVEGVTHIKIQNNSETDVALEDNVLIPAIRDKEDGDNIFILSPAPTSKPAVVLSSP